MNTERSNQIATFQIEQNYGVTGKSYSYFDAAKDTSIDELKSLAVEQVNSEYSQMQNKRFILHDPKPPRPTLLVSEYLDGQKVRGGISFKVKWR